MIDNHCQNIRTHLLVKQAQVLDKMMHARYFVPITKRKTILVRKSVGTWMQKHDQRKEYEKELLAVCTAL